VPDWRNNLGLAIAVAAAAVVATLVVVGLLWMRPSCRTVDLDPQRVSRVEWHEPHRVLAIDSDSEVAAICAELRGGKRVRRTRRRDHGARVAYIKLVYTDQSILMVPWVQSESGWDLAGTVIVSRAIDEMAADWHARLEADEGKEEEGTGNQGKGVQNPRGRTK
jgi:hypothetical protein